MAFFTRRHPVVPLRGVHLDLKGNPPSPARLLSLLDVFETLRLNVVLVEWEDAFPWRRYPALKSPTAYAPDLVRRFLDRAAGRGINVIPLVQCFGHAENALRLPRFRRLREVPDNVAEFCASHPGSARLVIDLVDDVITACDGRTGHFHLGGDEAWHMGSCARCRRAVSKEGKAAVYLRHVRPILDHLNDRGIRPILWDDMMRGWDEAALREIGAQADLMAWSYGARPVGAREGFLHEGHLAKYARAGATVWAASAYKGGDGPCRDVPDAAARAANNAGWAAIAHRHRLTGMVATAWSRYNTFMAPCETIEASLHTLAIAAAAMWDGRVPREPEREARALLKRRLGRRAFARFEACHRSAAALGEWSRGWHEWLWEDRERVAQLAGEPERRNPGALRHLDAQMARQLPAGRRRGREFVTAHRGLIPDRWLRAYAASRLLPLQRRFLNARRAR